MPGVEAKTFIIPGIPAAESPSGEEIQPGRILFPEQVIKEGVFFTSRQIARDHVGHELVLVGLQKGSFVYIADLTRGLTKRGLRDQRIEFLRLASYGGDRTASGGIIEGPDELPFDVEGKHVLVVEDVYDTGRTLRKAQQLIESGNPASIDYTVLIVKEGALEVGPTSIEYPVFTVPGMPWVGGYGIDTLERDRNLPYVIVREKPRPEDLLKWPGGPDGT